MRQRCRGFSYIALMILVAILSMATVATVQVGAAIERRHAEAELLRIGADFERALASYRVASPVGASKHPRELQDLLLDPRYPAVRRHLRAVRPDPLTHSADWGFVRGPDGGIVAIHSLSPLAPNKVAGFAPRKEAFAQAERYSDWLFTDPAIVLVRPATAGTP